MSKSILDFFKIEPKLTSNHKIKEEKEENFEIVIKAEPKTTNEDEGIQKFQECKSQVIQKNNKQLFDYKHFLIPDKNGHQKEHICKFCGKKMTELSYLTHIKRFHPTEFDFISCKICGRNFMKIESLKLHVRTLHPNGQNEKFQCDIDGKSFKARKNLSSHMQRHLNTSVKCPICLKSFRRLYLNSHIRYLHKNDAIFECKICEKRFKAQIYLTKHLKVHNKEFKCDVCSRMLPSNAELSKHKRNYHENPATCEICGKKFTSKTNLKHHQNNHKIFHQKAFKCFRCDYATDYKHNFKNHKEFHERQDKKFAAMKNPLRCEKCLTFSRNKTALKKHLNNVHQEDIFQCDLCAIFIKLKFNLKIHMKIHTTHNNLLEK